MITFPVASWEIKQLWVKVRDHLAKEAEYLRGEAECEPPGRAAICESEAQDIDELVREIDTVLDRMAKAG